MKKMILLLLCCGLGLATACIPGPSVTPDRVSAIGEDVAGTTDEPDSVTEAAEVNKPDLDAEDLEDLRKVIEPQKPVKREIVKKAEKPEAVFHLVKAAFANGDYGAIFDRVSAKSVERFGEVIDMIVKRAGSIPEDLAADRRAEIEARVLKPFGVDSLDELKEMSLREVFIAMGKVAVTNGTGNPMDKMELVRVEMGEDGKSAVIITREGDDKEDKIPVFLENGEWKIGLFEPGELAEDDEEHEHGEKDPFEDDDEAIGDDADWDDQENNE